MCLSTPIIDLSLHFRAFGDGPQLGEPIVRLSLNGIFDVRMLPEDTAPTAVFETSAIGYIPRHQFAWRASDLVRSPSLLLPTREAAEIAARVTMHTFAVIIGTANSLIGTADQSDTLAKLRQMYIEPLRTLAELLDTKT